MRALDELRAEHAVILSVLDAAGEARDEEGWARLLYFIKQFVEAKHHGKEERVLFPRMAADPVLQGMAGVLHEDHERGAALIAEIEQTLARHADAPAIERVFSAYTHFLRQHMERENEMIFEVAERTLDEGTVAEMLAEFAEIEAETGYDSALANLRTSAMVTRRR